MRTMLVSVGCLGWLALSGCGGGGGPLEGTWARTLSGEGEVTMTVKGNHVTLQLPEPRWPESDDLVATVALAGETLNLSDMSGPAACDAPAPAYTAHVEGGTLSISGGTSDPCGGRRVALVGEWQKRS